MDQRNDIMRYDAFGLETPFANVGGGSFSESEELAWLDIEAPLSDLEEEGWSSQVSEAETEGFEVEAFQSTPPAEACAYRARVKPSSANEQYDIPPERDEEEDESWSMAAQSSEAEQQLYEDFGEPEQVREEQSEEYALAEQLDFDEAEWNENLTAFEPAPLGENFGWGEDEALSGFEEFDSFEAEVTIPLWQQKVFRALHAGERSINRLMALGRADGGKPKDVQHFVLTTLRIPFPRVAQQGGVPCARNVRQEAEHKPEASEFFTGRFESTRGDQRRYFWAINQAGRTIVAIRSPRGISRTGQRVDPPQAMVLRGDVQADGKTAVLFRADKPHEFWGYLKQQDKNRTFRFHFRSYEGSNGQRVMVDVDTERDDEILALSVDDRPTMMGSLIQSLDPVTSQLVKQREWFPLTLSQFEVLQTGGRSDALRDLLENYLRLPAPRSSTERRASERAAGLIQNYVEHLFWDGDRRREPAPIDPTGPNDENRRVTAGLRSFTAEARRRLPNGHYNNPQLAAFVAKMFLAESKFNREGGKQSFLDWLTKIAQQQKLTRMAELLEVPLAPPTGSYRYRVQFVGGYGAYGLALGAGILVVEKLSEPTWPRRVLYDVFLKGAGTFGGDSGELFDLEFESAREWMPDDFEGSLYLGGVSASFGFGPFKPKVPTEVGTLQGKNGLAFDFNDIDVKVRGQPMKKPSKRPKLKFGGKILHGSIERQQRRIFDFSKPFPPSVPVAGDLPSAVHFCFGSSLLMPAGRQYLRVVCAEQLALLRDPAANITIVGHTDRPDSFKRNTDLSRLRAENVKRALWDILGEKLGRARYDAIKLYPYGEIFAALTGKRENERSPKDRRSDLYVNGRLVATLAENPVKRNTQ